MNPDHSPYRVVGAYAAQPDDVAERYRYFEDVLSLPGVDGLEISWRSPTWEQDAPILAEVLSKQVRGHHVLTLVGAESEAVCRRQALISWVTRRTRRRDRMEMKAISMKATRCSVVRSKMVFNRR